MRKNNKTASTKNNSNPPTAGLQLNVRTLGMITLLLFGIMIFAGVLTQIVPAGEYLTAEDGSIISEIDGESTYHRIGDSGYRFWRVFTAPFEIFTTSDAFTGVAIMAFIVLIGGTFLVLENAGVLNYIMSSIVKSFSSRKYLLLALMVLVCMMLSSVVGILEESITVVPLAVAISLALGWDSLVGVGMSLVAIAFGFTAATFNPFNVGVVQSMAELPMFSGLLYRIPVFIGVYVILVLFLVRYAKKIERNPEKSIVYESDRTLREKYSTDVDEELLARPEMKRATRTFVGCICSVFVLAAVSFIAKTIDSIPENVAEIIGYLPMAGMAVMFTVGGLSAASIAGIRGKKLFGGFLQGVKAISPCVPLIIFVMSITFILREGKIIDTILYSVYNLISGFKPSASLMIVFGFIVLLSFFIGSGTAKAFLIMPLVLPLADMIGITRQSVVLAFCLSDGFCNILYPTSGVMLIAIGLVNISYGKYLRWTWKLFLCEFLLSAVILLGAVAINYS